MIKQNNNRQSFSTIANDRITALYCRLSRDDEYKCQSKNVQICSLKNVQFYN